MKYYTEVWQAIKDSISLSDREDPLAENLPDAREDPYSGVWYRHEDGEEEAATSDVVEDGIYMNVKFLQKKFKDLWIVLWRQSTALKVKTEKQHPDRGEL